MSDTLSLPSFRMPLPEYGTSPGMEALEADVWPWLEERRLIDDERIRERLIRAQPHFTTALYFPHADAAHLITPNRYMAWAFIVDDFLDDALGSPYGTSVQQLCEELATVPLGERTPTHPLGHALVEIMDMFRAEGRSSQWCHAFAVAHADWVRTYPVESGLTRRCRTLPFEDYVEHRRASVGEETQLLLQEYVRDVDLPACVRNLPAMAEARNRVSEWIGLYNDVYSAAKEQSVGYPHNSVLLVHDRLGRSLAESADVVSAVLSGLLEQFDACCRAIPGQIRAVLPDSSPVIEEAQHVVEGYRHLLRGNFDYHIDNPRYEVIPPADPHDSTSATSRAASTAHPQETVTPAPPCP
ncbi:terpene synthase family protein [Streptomyces sp. NPDC054796]